MLEKIKTNIKSALLSKQFKKLIIFGFFYFAIFSFWIDTTFATDSDIKWNLEYAEEKLLHLISISASIIGWLTAMISMLLDPTWTNWTIFGIWDSLKTIWIFVSNIVYLIFAWILIAISFANIVWRSDEMFMLKKALPKFIVWVMIVPFSWFIVQFFISLSSVLTVSVYTWPIETIKANWTDMMKKDVEDWCTKRVINLQWSTITTWTDVSDDTSTSSWFFVCQTEQTTNIWDIINWKTDKSDVSLGWIIWLYSFWIMDVWSLDKLKQWNLWDITTLANLSAKSLFDVFFLLVYLVILLALFVTLFIRVILLWIFSVASPLFWLMYFLWSWKLWEKVDKFSFKSFFGLVMVPVYVAWALSFWFMFLVIIWKWISEDTNTNFNLDEFQLWTVTIVINWSMWDSKNDKNLASTIFGTMKWLLGYLMLKIFWLAFLWMAVMAALKQSSITYTFIKPIEDFWNAVWKFALESPKYMPIPWTNWLSFAWASDVFAKVKNHRTNEQSKLSEKWAKDHLKFLDTPEQKSVTNDLELLNTLPDKDLMQGIKKLLSDHSEWDLAMKVDELATIMEKSGIKWTKDIREARNDEVKLIKALTKINNDNKDLQWWPLLWKPFITEEETKQYVWGKAWTSTPTDASKEGSQPSNITFNIIPEWVKSGDNIIWIWEAWLIANQISEQYKWKTPDEIEKMIKTAVRWYKTWTLDQQHNDDNDDTKKLVEEVIKAIKAKDEKLTPDQRVIKIPEEK